MPVIKNQLGGKFINIEAPFRAIQQSGKSHTSFHDCSAAIVANVAGYVVNLSDSVTIVSNGGLIVNLNLIPSTTTITNHTGMIFNINIGDLPHETGNDNIIFTANFMRSIGRVVGQAILPYEDEYESSTGDPPAGPTAGPAQSRWKAVAKTAAKWGDKGLNLFNGITDAVKKIVEGKRVGQAAGGALGLGADGTQVAGQGQDWGERSGSSEGSDSSESESGDGGVDSQGWRSVSHYSFGIEFTRH
ncbi:hypothetical protein FQN50_005033 [Emmonsiellopsis sp. PD_5]|nr:hypothetical protein FQN50_005033 [Emmonsiellopsis sp. PD_5]